MFDNFLNLLNKDWNIQHRRNFAGLQDIAQSSRRRCAGPLHHQRRVGDHAESDDGLRPYHSANFINVSGSVWRIKVGLSYDF